MPLPEFTDDELLVISYIKSQKASSRFNSYMWGYLTGAGLLAGVAVYHSNIVAMFAAVVVVCVFRIYEERLQLKWMPTWQSVIAKYESALETTDTRAV